MTQTTVYSGFSGRQFAIGKTLRRYSSYGLSGKPDSGKSRPENMLFTILNEALILLNQCLSSGFFFPGKKFTMSMTFELARHVDKCPRCPDSTAQCGDLEMKCNTYGLIFSKRRATEAKDKIRSCRPDSSASSYKTTHTSNPPTERKYSSQHVTFGPVPPPDSIGDFNRVRIIETLSVLKHKVTVGEASTQKTLIPLSDPV